MAGRVARAIGLSRKAPTAPFQLHPEPPPGGDAVVRAGLLELAREFGGRVRSDRDVSTDGRGARRPFESRPVLSPSGLTPNASD